MRFDENLIEASYWYISPDFSTEKRNTCSNKREKCLKQDYVETQSF